MIRLYFNYAANDDRMGRVVSYLTLGAQTKGIESPGKRSLNK